MNPQSRPEPMTVKERLHQLIEALSPDELAEAERRLSTLQRPPALYTLNNAPRMMKLSTMTLTAD